MDSSPHQDTEANLAEMKSARYGSTVSQIIEQPFTYVIEIASSTHTASQDNYRSVASSLLHPNQYLGEYTHKNKRENVDTVQTSCE